MVLMRSRIRSYTCTLALGLVAACGPVEVVSTATPVPATNQAARNSGEAAGEPKPGAEEPAKPAQVQGETIKTGDASAPPFAPKKPGETPAPPGETTTKAGENAGVANDLPAEPTPPVNPTVAAVTPVMSDAEYTKRYKAARDQVYKFAMATDAPNRENALNEIWQQWQKMDQEFRLAESGIAWSNRACIMAYLEMMADNDPAAASFGLRCRKIAANLSKFAPYLQDSAKSIEQSSKENDPPLRLVTVPFDGDMGDGTVLLRLRPVEPTNAAYKPFALTIVIKESKGTADLMLSDGLWRFDVVDVRDVHGAILHVRNTGNLDPKSIGPKPETRMIYLHRAVH